MRLLQTAFHYSHLPLQSKKLVVNSAEQTPLYSSISSHHALCTPAFCNGTGCEQHDTQRTQENVVVAASSETAVGVPTISVTGTVL